VYLIDEEKMRRGTLERKTMDLQLAVMKLWREQAKIELEILDQVLEPAPLLLPSV